MRRRYSRCSSHAAIQEAKRSRTRHALRPAQASTDDDFARKRQNEPERGDITTRPTRGHFNLIKAGAGASHGIAPSVKPKGAIQLVDNQLTLRAHLTPRANEKSWIHLARGQPRVSTRLRALFDTRHRAVGSYTGMRSLPSHLGRRTRVGIVNTASAEVRTQSEAIRSRRFQAAMPHGASMIDSFATTLRSPQAKPWQRRAMSINHPMAWDDLQSGPLGEAAPIEAADSMPCSLRCAKGPVRRCKGCTDTTSIHSSLLHS